MPAGSGRLDTQKRQVISASTLTHLVKKKLSPPAAAIKKYKPNKKNPPNFPTNYRRSIKITAAIRSNFLGSLSNEKDSKLYYIKVKEDAKKIRVALEGGSKDFDLWAKLGSLPTEDDHDWRAYTKGDEDKSFKNPGKGIWYLLVKGYESGGDFDLTVLKERTIHIISLSTISKWEPVMVVHR